MRDNPGTRMRVPGTEPLITPGRDNCTGEGESDVFLGTLKYKIVCFVWLWFYRTCVVFLKNNTYGPLG
jgi:hypothetical protein